MDDEQRARNRQRAHSRALGLLTAWMEAGPGVPWETSLMWPVLDEQLREGDAAQLELLTGLIQVSQSLLVRLEEETGRPMGDILQEEALRFGEGGTG